MPGVIDVAAPVRHLGSAVAALTVPYINQANTVSIDDAIAHVRETAAAVSEALAGIL